MNGIDGMHAASGNRNALATLAGAGLALVLATPAAAQQSNPLHEAVGAPEDLVLRASVRARSEGFGGQFRPTGPEEDYMRSFRTIVFAEYDAGPVRFGGELRDARGYGQALNSTAGVSEINALEPAQAYVALEIDGVAGKGSKGLLTAGRFGLDIGSGRLVARPDFANSVVSYTGAVLDWRSAQKDRLVLFWALPSARQPGGGEALRENAVRWDRARTAVQFFGGSFTKTRAIAGIGAEAYAYRLAEADSLDQPTRDRRLFTYGGRLFRGAAAGAFDFEVEAARQTGEARATAGAGDTTDRPVEALLVHGEVGRKFAGGWSPRISLHGDYASGDDADPTKLTRFDTLYGSSRTDFGPTSFYGAVNRANLVSAGVRIEAAPSKRVDGFVMYRALWLDEATDSFASTGIRDRTGRSGRFAGNQVEGRIRYWVVPKRFRMEVGGAWLAKGAFLRDAPNARDTGNTRYAYLDLSVEL